MTKRNLYIFTLFMLGYCCFCIESNWDYFYPDYSISIPRFWDIHNFFAYKKQKELHVVSTIDNKLFAVVNEKNNYKIIVLNKTTGEILEKIHLGDLGDWYIDCAVEIYNNYYSLGFICSSKEIGVKYYLFKYSIKDKKLQKLIYHRDNISLDSAAGSEGYESINISMRSRNGTLFLYFSGLKSSDNLYIINQENDSVLKQTKIGWKIKNKPIIYQNFIYFTVYSYVFNKMILYTYNFQNNEIRELLVLEKIDVKKTQMLLLKNEIAISVFQRDNNYYFYKIPLNINKNKLIDSTFLEKFKNKEYKFIVTYLDEKNNNGLGYRTNEYEKIYLDLVYFNSKTNKIIARQYFPLFSLDDLIYPLDQNNLFQFTEYYGFILIKFDFNNFKVKKIDFKNLKKLPKGHFADYSRSRSYITNVVNDDKHLYLSTYGGTIHCIEKKKLCGIND